MMLLEALCQETPTLASDIPENTSILPPGFPTFRAGDAVDLAARLAALMDADPGERAAAARTARAWVRERYDWDAIAAAYERLYAAAGGPANAPPGTCGHAAPGAPGAS
jgi:glycosyltransferase involved in cell wall biosynthesis